MTFFSLSRCESRGAQICHPGAKQSDPWKRLPTLATTSIIDQQLCPYRCVYGLRIYIWQVPRGHSSCCLQMISTRTPLHPCSAHALCWTALSHVRGEVTERLFCSATREMDLVKAEKHSAFCRNCLWGLLKTVQSCRVANQPLPKLTKTAAGISGDALRVGAKQREKASPTLPKSCP